MVASRQVSPLLVIVGPTASGKSDLAIKLAKHFNGEIICADSWTVRRGTDIGAAKPSAAEQADVPHHLLDVVSPDKDFTAAVFKRLAQAAIKDIAARGKLPIMVGGSGLYIDGVLYDYGFLPAGDRGDRQALNQLSREQLLKEIDDLGFELGNIDTFNKRRLIRLIETNGAKPTKLGIRPNSLIIGIRVESYELKDRITRRVDAMIKAGLEREVRDLVERYGWDCEALKGIGYSQWQGYLSGSENLENTRQKIIKATLDLAKRQYTWFKRNSSIHWFPTPVNQSSIVEFITTFLEDGVPS